MERYFSPDGNLGITDKIAEGLLKNMIKYGKLSLENSQNYEARAEIMWSGSLAHNGLTGCGGTGDWSTHELEHEVEFMILLMEQDLLLFGVLGQDMFIKKIQKDLLSLLKMYLI